MNKMHLVTSKESAAEEEAEANKKFCTDCETTKTPLWRGGPSGPKSLCNACGIRYRKKKRTTSTPTSPATNRSESQDKKRDGRAEESIRPSSSKCLSSSLKMSLVLLGKDLLLEKTKNVAKKQRRQRRKRKLGEEELAAASLVALSCGSVFA